MAQPLSFPDRQSSLIVFCDGACSGNPGPGGWGVVVLPNDREVWELGGGAANTTNNQMELSAALHALKALQSLPGPVIVYTDSSYLISGITQWIWGWKKKGWKTETGQPVANRELWEALWQEVQKRGKLHPIHWQWVRGHQGVEGNERADTIAVSFSQQKPIELYRGLRRNYRVELTLPELTSHQPSSFIKERSLAKKPLAYLSLLGGVLERHLNWTDCEKRVKGRSGAKFKKVYSPAEEAVVLKEWGVLENSFGKK